MNFRERLKQWVRLPFGEKPRMLTCEELVGLLADYLDGSLDHETARDLERHLDGCVSCHNFIKTYKATTAWVKEITYEDMPDELKDRLASFLKTKIRQEKSGDT
jgi:anti-sigma factor RsiW